MEYVYIGLFAAIFLGIYLNYRLIRELATVVQATAQQLDSNLAEALKNVVEELPFNGEPINPLVGIIGDVIKNNLNRGDNGRFVQAEVLPPIKGDLE